MKINTVHRRPIHPKQLKRIPSYVAPGDELVSDLDATKMFHEAGQDMGNSRLYKAYRNDLLSAYIINYKRYYIKAEIVEAIKSYPRDVPREDGYYPCKKKLNAELKRLKEQVETMEAKKQMDTIPAKQELDAIPTKQQYSFKYTYINIA